MNRCTNILGVITILAAIFSVFYLDTVGWFDASFGIASGVGLIYTKNSKLINEIIKLRKHEKELAHHDTNG